MPTTEPLGWTRLFADDFLTDYPEGSFLQDTDWTAYPYGWRDTSNNGHYDPRIISTHDGMMDMHLRKIDGTWRVAAPEPAVINRSNGRTSARISVRFRGDPVEGFKTAWLLWPMSNAWPRDGEIDFPEGQLHGTIEAYMHRQGAVSGGDQDQRTTTARFPDWHTATVEWVAGVSCAFYLDGQLLGSVITSRVPSTPMRFVLQTETRVSSVPPPAGAQAHVFVDWITVARRAQ